MEKATKFGEDFPLVCDTCLGDNGYLRMTKLPNHAACKLTGKPFTVFRWRPSRKSGVFSSTIVCYEIANEKNICQSCLNDLDYGVPIALREAFVRSQSQGTALQEKQVPTSQINQSYYFKQKLQQLENGGTEADQVLAQTVSASDQVATLARNFYQDVTQSKSKSEELSQVKSSVVETKRKHHDSIPEDKTITTLFLAGLSADTSEEEVKEVMAKYGVVIRIYRLVDKLSCFVQFASREEAERAAFNTNNNLVLKGHKLSVNWAYRHDPYHQYKQPNVHSTSRIDDRFRPPTIIPNLPANGTADFYDLPEVPLALREKADYMLPAELKGGKLNEEALLIHKIT